MKVLQFISILIEIVIAGIGINLATIKKKNYGWGITVTFFIYVFYDLANALSVRPPKDFLSVIFFIATCSMAYVVLCLYREK